MARRPKMFPEVQVTVDLRGQGPGDRGIPEGNIFVVIVKAAAAIGRNRKNGDAARFVEAMNDLCDAGTHNYDQTLEEIRKWVHVRYLNRR